MTSPIRYNVVQPAGLPCGCTVHDEARCPVCDRVVFRHRVGAAPWPWMHEDDTAPRGHVARPGTLAPRDVTP